MSLQSGLIRQEEIKIIHDGVTVVRKEGLAKTTKCRTTLAINKLSLSRIIHRLLENQRSSPARSDLSANSLSSPECLLDLISWEDGSRQGSDHAAPQTLGDEPRHLALGHRVSGAEQRVQQDTVEGDVTQEHGHPQRTANGRARVQIQGEAGRLGGASDAWLEDHIELHS